MNSTLKRWVALLLCMVMLVPAGGYGEDDGDGPKWTDLFVFSLFATLDGVGTTESARRELKSRVYNEIQGFAPDGYNIVTDNQIITHTGSATQVICVQANNTSSSIIGSSCTTVSVYGGYVGTRLRIDAESTLGLFQTKSPVEVNNAPGSIKTADVWPGSSGTSFAAMPEILIMRPGVSVTVAGEEITNTSATEDLILLADGSLYLPPKWNGYSQYEDVITLPVGYEKTEKAYLLSGNPRPEIMSELDSWLSWENGKLVIAPGVSVGLHTRAIVAGSASNFFKATLVVKIHIIDPETPIPAIYGNKVLITSEGYEAFDYQYLIVGNPKAKAYIIESQVPGATVTEDGLLHIPLGLTTYADGSDRQYRIKLGAENANGKAEFELFVSVDRSIIPPAMGGKSEGSDTIYLREGYSGYSKAYAINGTKPFLINMTPGANTGGAKIGEDGTLTIPGGLRPGRYTASFTATNASGSAAMSVNVIVRPVEIQSAPEALPGGVVYTPYHQTLTASGGHKPYTFTLTDGKLPEGLTLAEDGVISGTSLTAKSESFTVMVTDRKGNQGTFDYTIAMAPPTLSMLPDALPQAKQGTTYHQVLAISEERGPSTFQLTAGTLPQGLTLAKDGTLSGTPAPGAQSATFTVLGMDVNGHTVSKEYTLAVEPLSLAITPQALPEAKQGAAYTASLAAEGGVAPYTFTVAQGTLPDGLALSPEGKITGEPSPTGKTATFTVKAMDSRGYEGSREYTVTVIPTVITFTPAALQSATQSQAHTETIAAAGGYGPYTFSLAPGVTLPDGLTLSSGGVISGMPGPGAESKTIVIQATDSKGHVGTKEYHITINPLVTQITPYVLRPATTKTQYTQSMAAAGGTGPYVFTIAAGALPQGITLSQDGVLSGVTQTSGVYTFTIKATDQNGYCRSEQYDLTVKPMEPLVITTDSHHICVLNESFELTLAASGGGGLHTFTLAEGTLPAGLTFTGNKISGTATEVVSKTLKYTVTDEANPPNDDAKEITLVVFPRATIHFNSSQPMGSIGSPFSEEYKAINGIGPYTYSIGGQLPAGLTGTAFTTDGGEDAYKIHGTPTEAGTFDINLKAIDRGTGLSCSFTIIIAIYE